MRWAIVIVLAAAAALPVLAQEPGGPVLAPVPKACETPGTQVISASPLPNVAIALKDRKQINILAIGSTSASLRGPVSGGLYAVVERFLESNFKGLDVNIVYRGVSGELAADAAERIKNEVALTGADLVLWQLGTADALAQVPVADFYATVSETVRWLKNHNVDVILMKPRSPSRAMCVWPNIWRAPSPLGCFSKKHQPHPSEPTGFASKQAMPQPDASSHSCIRGNCGTAGGGCGTWTKAYSGPSRTGFARPGCVIGFAGPPLFVAYWHSFTARQPSSEAVVPRTYRMDRRVRQRPPAARPAPANPLPSVELRVCPKLPELRCYHEAE
jgi:hypothetical protein